MAPVIVYPLKAVYWLFLPVIFLFSQVARLGTRLVGAGKASQSIFLSREQLRAVVEMTERQFDLSAFRHGRIRRAIRFGDTQAAEVMIPLPDITLFDCRGSVRRLIQVMQQNGYRPIPVYKDDVVNIVGLISLTPWEILNEDIRSAAVEGPDPSGLLCCAAPNHCPASAEFAGPRRTSGNYSNSTPCWIHIVESGVWERFLTAIKIDRIPSDFSSYIP
jgi:hypothetical protein